MAIRQAQLPNIQEYTGLLPQSWKYMRWRIYGCEQMQRLKDRYLNIFH